MTIDCLRTLRGDKVNDGLEKKNEMPQHRIDVLKAYLREECGADSANVSIKDGREDLPELLGKALVEEVAKSDVDIDKVNELIRVGANVNSKLDEGITALMKASMCGYVEVVDVLISNGADVNLTSDADQTALMWASAYSHKEIIEMLISNGANVDLVDKKGNAAMYYAINEDIKGLLEDAESR